MPGAQEELVANFNRLVYEYLLKMQYEKTAKAFKSEAQVVDIHVTDTPPVLLNWYHVFMETADVRSGKTYIPEVLNRIEGIMLKLENEKQRYSRMSAIVAQPRRTPSGPPVMTRLPAAAGSGIHEPLPPVERKMYDRPPIPRDVPKAMGMPMAHSALHPAFLKEYDHIDLSLPYIYAAQYCPLHRIILCACADGKLYFYSLAKSLIELSLPMKTRKTKALVFNEGPDGLFVSYEIEKHAMAFIRYVPGHKEDARIVELERTVLSYCFFRDILAVLFSDSMLSLYSLGGELIRKYELASPFYSVGALENCLLLVDQSRATEFDYRIGQETKTLIKGNIQTVHVKDGLAFAVFPDVIQVYSDAQPFPLCSVKGNIPCRDIAFVQSAVAICTGTDVYYNGSVLPAPNSIGMFKFSWQALPGLMTISSDGRIILLSCSQ